MKRVLLAAWLALAAACVPVAPPVVVPVQPPVVVPPPAYGPLDIDINTCDAASNAVGDCTYRVGGRRVHVNVAAGVFVDAVTNPDGYALVTIPANRRPLPEAYVVVDEGDGWNAAEMQLHPEDCNGTTPGGCHNFVPVTAEHVNPSKTPLNVRAAIRGAMWPMASQCPEVGPVPFGPRPGQPDNIIATDFWSNYTADQQEAYAKCFKKLGWTHVVMGPVVDSDGYHGQYAPRDWHWEDPAHANGDNWEKYLDLHQWFADRGFFVVDLLHPDGWTFDQFASVMGPLLDRPRAQSLITLAACPGWEPTKYDWSSRTWGLYVRFCHDHLPNAVNLIHTVSDVDAPVGTDALYNDNGRPNAEGWEYVISQGLHGWLIQNGPYAGTPADDPTLANNFAAQFDPGPRGAAAHGVAWHFAGNAGWPTGSAWGPGIPLCLYNAENTAYEGYWHARPTETGRWMWGDLAVASGACGYLDGGSVPVPVRR